VNNSCPTEHDATVEDTYTINIKTNTGEERIFNILDTAGEEDYQTMMDNWIKVADGFLLLFAINEKESFEALESKIEKIKNNDKDNVPIILVGNKCDLDDQRIIEKQTAEDLAKKIGTKYYETSALTDQNGNCKVVFEECAQMIIKSDSPEKSDKCLTCSIW
jgi:small GTP-binding protein